MTVEVCCKFEIFSYSDQDTVHSVEISSSETVNSLKTKICAALQISADAINPASDNVRLWYGPSHDAFNEYSVVEGMGDKQISETPLLNSHFIMVEEMIDGRWPNDGSSQFGREKRKALVLPPPSYETQDSAPGAWPIKRYSFSPERPAKTNGVTGLMNLGNTCFMNSALQCLSNTRPLTKYFLDGTYKREINTDNPLGMHGEVAIAYGDLVNKLWRDHESAIAPRDFKFTIGRFAPQFVGYQQQDSQELTTFLLDGLHEDLNRIVKKPYIEVPDYDGKSTDGEFADKLWSIHKARNDSIIVDNFQGQYKSTLVCPECNKVSITFDPYMYLSLPLPIKKKTSLNYLFVPSEDSQKMPILETINLPGETTMEQLRSVLGRKYGVEPKKLIPAEEFQHKIYKRYAAAECIRDIGKSDKVVIYECLVDEDLPQTSPGGGWNSSFSFGRRSQTVTSSVDDESGDDNPKPLNICVYFAAEAQSMYRSGFQEFGIPLFVTMPNKIKYEELFDLMKDQVQRFTKIDLNKIPVVDETEEAQLDEIGEIIDAQKKMNVNKPDKKPLFQIKVNSEGSAGNIADLKLAVDESLTIKKNNILVICFNSDVHHRLFDSENSLFEQTEISDADRSDKDAMKQVDLYSCFKEFEKVEQLGAEDAWFCPNCKKHQQASKKLEIWSLPTILVIHLKRFSHNRYHRDKLENYIDYPLEGLDLTDYIVGPSNEKPIYDLYAVSNHMGGLGGGHYTAYAKNPIDGKWYDFDDSRVSRVDEATVKTQMAYLLFYQKRSSVDDNSVFEISKVKEDIIPVDIPPPSADYNDLITAPTSPDQMRDESDAGSMVVNGEREEDMDFEFVSPAESQQDGNYQ